MVNVGIPYMEHMGFEFLVIFIRCLRGIDHHDTLPEKKTPLKIEIDGWKRILFLVGGRLFFRGKLAVFKEWSFENSLHCLNL